NPRPRQPDQPPLVLGENLVRGCGVAFPEPCEHLHEGLLFGHVRESLQGGFVPTPSEYDILRHPCDPCNGSPQAVPSGFLEGNHLSPPLGSGCSSAVGSCGTRPHSARRRIETTPA